MEIKELLYYIDTIPLLVKQVEILTNEVKELKTGLIPPVMTREEVASYMQVMEKTASKVMQEIGYTIRHTKWFCSREDFFRYLTNDKNKQYNKPVEVKLNNVV